MAMVDAAPRHRDPLPSINALDLEKHRLGRGDHSKFPVISGLSVSTAPLGSPTTTYSGPPPPYSYPPSNAGSSSHPSGHLSPPDSCRRSTRDGRESPTTTMSLPSIHEALGDKGISYSAAPVASMPTAASQPITSAPPSAMSQNFSDPPKGPSNPFSQPVAPASAYRDSSLTSQNVSSQAAPSHEVHPPRPAFTSVNEPDRRAQSSQMFASPRSPRPNAAAFPSVQHHRSSMGMSQDQRSPSTFGPPTADFTFQTPYANGQSSFTQTTDSFPFERPPKADPAGSAFHPHDPTRPYGDSVKRHLEIYDAEIALDEIGRASSRTLDFCRTWGPRTHQSSRTGYFPEALPSLHEIDDMTRQSHRVLEELSRVREVVIAQQHALSEQRARAARGDEFSDEYGNSNDEYKLGGVYAAGDAKKRRGKAAPPGRCHSCNRAETPEWRRGPDGARTLCNACGLHYAKLTRKLGPKNAAALSGANLRPKNLDQRLSTQL